VSDPPLLPQALRLARRELRSGLHGFGVFLACLFLGVFALSAIGSFTAAARSGLQADASALLGGDLEIRQMHRPLTSVQLDFLGQQGQLSQILELRTMAANAANSEHSLVELKAVDHKYPLYGQLQLDPPQSLEQALDGGQGAVVENSLLQRLKLNIGDGLKIGDITLKVNAVLRYEPDRDLRPFTLGPRLLVSCDSLEASGLLRPGSLVTYTQRLRLADPKGDEPLVSRLNEAFPEAGWRLRTRRNAAPRVTSVLDRMGTNLSLLGLSALLIGGLGVAGAVRGYLRGKQLHIATLKCLGATSRLVFTSYLLQILFLGTLGSLAGLMAGAALPWLLVVSLGASLPIPLQLGIYPQELLIAGLFGLLIALLFSLKELGRARLVPPALLFRGAASLEKQKMDKTIRWMVATVGLLLMALAWWSSADRRLAGWFILGSLACFLLFRLLSSLVIRISRKIPPPTNPALRLALASIHRRGSPATSVLFSLGLGLTLLVMIAQVQANLDNLVASTLPQEAPAFFFLDIQPDQLAEFEHTLNGISAVKKIERYPTLRGRITAINGVPSEEVKIAPEVRWAVRGDRFLSYAARPPAGGEITAGSWWPEDYRGEPLISLTEDVAKGFGLHLGDSLTVNILGRDISAKVTSLRTADWSSLQLNFVILFSPGVLEQAPQTHIAAVHVAAGGEDQVFRAITSQFANISAIATAEVLANVGQTVDRISTLFKAMAALTLLSGFLVLAGAISADQHRRIHDAVIFKICGATRGNILLSFAAEFCILGLAAAAISTLAGCLAALAIVKGPMNIAFQLYPWIVLATLAAGIALTLVLGLSGTWKALGKKPAVYLRDL